MGTKIIYISGMHCTSCEKLLEDEFLNISGVEKVRADRKKNMVEISYAENEPDFSEVQKTAKKFGYTASKKPIGAKGQSRKGGLTQWLYAISIALAILLLFKTFINSGLADRFNLAGLGQNAGLNYPIAFIIGIAASLSSCLAIVGSVVIAFSEKYQTENSGFFQGSVKPNLFFHIGRLFTFFALGGLLGLIGGEINISGNFVSIYTIIIAAVMVWLGLNILGILPSITNLGLAMPKGMTSRWNSLKESNHRMAPFLLGGLSFFLPCGFTQSMQVLALASGSFMRGSLSLFFFALGTVPSLLALGMATTFLKNKKTAIFQKVAGILIIIFAVYTFSSGLALAGVKSNIFSSSQKENVAASTASPSVGEKKPVQNGNIQAVEMHITSRGYEPGIIKIKKNIPVEWTIYGDSVSGCTSKIIVPGLNIEKNISSGKNTIIFTPTKSGEIPFSCWMGMVRGKFIVG
jgi:sulfite exporter TauE/SafE/copper chaperone CopZ